MTLRDLTIRAFGWSAAALLLWLGLAGPSTTERPSHQRLRAYDLGDASTPVVWPVREGVDQLRLLVWLTDPAWGPADERSTRSAQLEASLVGVDGTVFRSATPWFRFRRSLQRIGGLLRPPSRIAGDPTGTTSDDRTWVLDLVPRDQPATLRLSVRESPPGATVHAVAWSGRRAALTGLVSAEASSAVNAATAADLGPWRWSELPDAWRERSHDRVWERLAADARGGFQVSVLEHHSGRGSWEAAGADGIIVPPGGAVAVNLANDEAAVFGAWWAADGSGPSPARYQLLGPNGLVTEEGDQVGPLRVVGAPATVRLALDPSELKPRLLRLWTTGPEPMVWGDPPRGDDGARRPTAPDLRRLEPVRIGPGQAARWPVRPGERIQVVARPRLPAGPLPGLADAVAVSPPVQIRARSLAEDGSTLSSDVFTANLRPSAYERYTEVDGLHTARVAEPTARELVTPNDAWSLTLEADATVDVVVSRWVRDDETMHPAYALDEEIASGRYVPRLSAPFEAIGPLDAPALMAAGRLPRIDAQVRLDGRAPRRESTPKLAVQPLVLRRPFGWLMTPGGRGGLARLGPRPVQAEPGPDGRVVIEARVPVKQIGSPVRVWVGDEEREASAYSGASTFSIEGLSGPTSLRTDAPGSYFVASARGPWRRVRAWRLAGEAIDLPIPADGGRVVVQSWGDVLSWQLDGELVPGALTGRAEVRSGVCAVDPEGPRAEPFSESGPAMPALQDVDLVIAQGRPGRSLRLAVDGRAWVRILTSWSPASADDDERFWVAGEASPLLPVDGP